MGHRPIKKPKQTDAAKLRAARQEILELRRRLDAALTPPVPTADQLIATLPVVEVNINGTWCQLSGGKGRLWLQSAQWSVWARRDWIYDNHPARLVAAVIAGDDPDERGPIR